MSYLGKEIEKRQVYFANEMDADIAKKDRIWKGIPNSVRKGFKEIFPNNSITWNRNRFHIWSTYNNIED